MQTNIFGSNFWVLLNLACGAVARLSDVCKPRLVGADLSRNKNYFSSSIINSKSLFDNMRNNRWARVGTSSCCLSVYFGARFFL